MSVINEQKSKLKDQSTFTFRLTLKYVGHRSPICCPVLLVVVAPWFPILEADAKVGKVLLRIIVNNCIDYMVKKSSAFGRRFVLSLMFRYSLHFFWSINIIAF